MQKYAEVAIENAVYHFDKPFSYLIPEKLEAALKSGMRVFVPFGAGNRLRVAMVLSIDEKPVEGAKEIAEILDKETVLSDNMLKLAKWMKNRYFCTAYDAIRPMIPSGLNFKIKPSYVLSDDFKDFDEEAYSVVAWNIISFLKKAGKSVAFEKLAKEFGITEDNPDFQRLIDEKIALKVNIAAARIRDALSKMVRPVSDFSGTLTKRQQSVYETLLDAGTVTERELRYFTGASAALIKALADKGAAEIFEYEVYRRPKSFHVITENEEEIMLSKAQEKVYSELEKEYAAGKFSTSLLYGVTGSGKTSVFMKLIQKVFADGRAVIIMVPEISLTSQTIALFSERFGENIAVFHSGLSLGERADEWKRVKRGEARIVIGTRSAVFAPVSNLGLIVIDEEQEHSYKSESSPRYDAREVARWRCASENAMCLLSSATPSVESFYMSRSGRYTLHELPERFGEAEIPNVELIDMNAADTVGADSLISVPLYEAIRDNIEEEHQSIILLNRRGYHHFATCKSCKEVMMCPNCSISLTYHSANNRLMCHYCGASIKLPVKCPKCGGMDMAFRGPGTQRVEEELEKIFPDARILRVDTDSMSGKFSLEKKLEEFSRGEYDIMVGTQMVAKGLNFENVTLVGVVSADNILFSDDFRGNERTFDLLTQVVGRAGRGRYSGTAMIQTYVPENPYLHLAAQQDYIGFYEREIQYRKALLYPPFPDILVIGFVGESEADVRKAANSFVDALMKKAESEHRDMPLRILSASPAAVMKVSNKFRYKTIIKCRNTDEFRQMISEELVSFGKNKEHSKVTAHADANPYTIL